MAARQALLRRGLPTSKPDPMDWYRVLPEELHQGLPPPAPVPGARYRPDNVRPQPGRSRPSLIITDDRLWLGVARFASKSRGGGNHPAPTPFQQRRAPKKGFNSASPRL